MVTDEFGRHEILDRVNILSFMFGDLVLSHPRLTLHEAVLAQNISQLLGELYQTIGAANESAGQTPEGK